MTMICRNCGTTFETRATTATRCPSCRAVVHISRAGAGEPTRHASRENSAPTDAFPGSGSVLDVVIALLTLASMAFELVHWWRGRWQRQMAEHAIEGAAGEVAVWMQPRAQ